MSMNICVDCKSIKNNICVKRAHVYYQLSNNYRTFKKKKVFKSYRRRIFSIICRLTTTVDELSFGVGTHRKQWLMVVIGVRVDNDFVILFHTQSHILLGVYDVTVCFHWKKKWEKLDVEPEGFRARTSLVRVCE